MYNQKKWYFTAQQMQVDGMLYTEQYRLKGMVEKKRLIQSDKQVLYGEKFK